MTTTTTSNDPVLAYMMKRRGGELPSLIEYLGLEYLGEIPEPLNAEAISMIPPELQDQIKDLPERYLNRG